MIPDYPVNLNGPNLLRNRERKGIRDRPDPRRCGRVQGDEGCVDAGTDQSLESWDVDLGSGLAPDVEDAAVALKDGRPEAIDGDGKETIRTEENPSGAQPQWPSAIRRAKLKRQTGICRRFKQQRYGSSPPSGSASREHEVFELSHECVISKSVVGKVRTDFDWETGLRARRLTGHICSSCGSHSDAGGSVGEGSADEPAIVEPCSPRPHLGDKTIFPAVGSEVGA